MDKHGIPISPKTKIGELLDNYPELEETLLEMSPAFTKLKNPILRKTIGRIATLQQAAAIGNIPVEKIVNTLRQKAGQENVTELETMSIMETKQPAWFDETRISIRFNATPLINAGEHPMGQVLSRLKELQPGDIFELQTPFLPAPIIEIIREKGYPVWTNKQSEDHFLTFVGFKES